ncbi:nicotinamide riboside kinase 1-like [Mercenaria mercenaria]|uniref:nicotinamide riboside kinase 1-like n=1 Tax=Mercenaria mercenaria TaxID=6596 RepID=UPI00234F1251|nr:nicotinamide riboside kinase 1-like [Mercenaria mercenaria]XP_045216875.2 nicotinamide riboside kinase 1-like [Mercenaria mercenaria]
MAKQMGQVIVIGLSGTTNSGKSTLAGQLVKKLPNCMKVCQDTYFLAPDDPRLEPIYIPELKHHNWEDYRSLEMDKMVNEVKQLKSRYEQDRGDNNMFLIVEGFSVFGWSPLAKLFDMKYFLSVDRDVCFERRKYRDYNPPDKPGYFEQVVWPMHLKHLNSIKDQEDIVYLDGNETTSLDKNVSRILSDISRLTCSENITPSNL